MCPAGTSSLDLVLMPNRSFTTALKHSACMCIIYVL